MKRQLLSITSFTLFLALLIPLAFASNRFGDALFGAVLALGFYTPIVLAAAGFALAWFGIQGTYRMLLTSGHGILFVLYALLLFVGRFGFQQA